MFARVHSVPVRIDPRINKTPKEKYRELCTARICEIINGGSQTVIRKLPVIQSARRR